MPGCGRLPHRPATFVVGTTATTWLVAWPKAGAMSNAKTIPQLVNELVAEVEKSDFEVDDRRKEIRRLDVEVGAACVRAGIAIPDFAMEENYLSPFGLTKIPHWNGTLPADRERNGDRFVYHFVATNNWRQAMQAISLAAHPTLAADGFVAASKIGWNDRFVSYKKIRKFLSETQTIRTRRPRNNRLEVHAGDWIEYWAKQNAAAFDSLDLAPDAIASAIARKGKLDKASGRK